ncbi:MAG: zinc ribbon domain-containing protein [Oscillospiraceae bacterium]|nr:zinc ribbon domain-containing protein [Oscillospiraceae bacterium]
MQNLLQSGHHPKTAGRYALVNPFAGLCRCICGSALVMQKSKKFRPRLVCQNQSHCHQKSILYQEFEKIILQILKQQLPEIVCRRNPDGLKQKILHQQISEIHGQQEKLYDFLERGIYSEEIFLARQKALSEKYQHLACQLSEEETSTEILKLSDMLELLESPEMPASVKNQFFRSVIREIIYSRNEQISLKLVLRI